MGISPHLARLRAVVGHELLVLPCVTVLPVNRVAYVPAVYEAEIVAGTPSPSDGELSEVAWFTPAELQTLPLSRFTLAVLTATGHLA